MSIETTSGEPGPVVVPAEGPAVAYRAALGRYEPAALRVVLQELGFEEEVGSGRATELAATIISRLDRNRVIEELIEAQSHEARLVLGLFALTEQASWPMAGMALALRLLGIEPGAALAGLLTRGLVAIRSDSSRPATADLEAPARPELHSARLFAHPEAMASARSLRPLAVADSPAPVERIRQAREADGLEPILRTAALWQRVDEVPLRQTQQGSLYKRDRDRLETDTALAGPIADMLEPLPDLIDLWLALARSVGLVFDEPGTDRIIAAPAAYWSENAIHLPQMLALRWLPVAELARARGQRGAPAMLPSAPFVAGGRPATPGRPGSRPLARRRRPGRRPGSSRRRVGAAH